MAKYFQDKNSVFVAPDNATNILDELPANVYTLAYNILTGFYLELVDDFNVPDKIYGTIGNKSEKIIKTYLSRESNTGVLLSGEKGSGKTMMSKVVSNVAREKNIPTIIINEDFEKNFCKFISDINQKCVIIFDEFEKVFGKNEQKKLLTLFDGTYTSDKLFLLTVNNLFYVDDFFLNRPGRIYYHIVFDSLEECFVKEYCDENLNDKSHIKSIVNYSKLIKSFNFDMLQTMVYECNLHKESPQKAYEMLNIRHISFRSNYYFEIIDTSKDMKFTGKAPVKPLSDERFYFTNYCDEKIKESDEDSPSDYFPYVVFSQENLLQAIEGRYEFKDREFKMFLKISNSSSNFSIAF